MAISKSESKSLKTIEEKSENELNSELDLIEKQMDEARLKIKILKEILKTSS
jgi:hypothetical protein